MQRLVDADATVRRLGERAAVGQAQRGNRVHPLLRAADLGQRVDEPTGVHEAGVRQVDRDVLPEEREHFAILTGMELS